MPRFREFPDAEAIVGAAIRQADITGLGPRVYTSMPANPTFPLIVIRRVPSAPMEEHGWDSANIDFNVYGNSKTECIDVAQKARIAVKELEGEHVVDPVAAHVSRVSDTLGLGPEDDPDIDRDRYMFGLRVYARSENAGS